MAIRKRRSPRRVLLFAAAAAVANGVVAAAFTTMLDPQGFPLLQSTIQASTSGGGSEDTMAPSSGGLQRVDLAYLGSFAVQHSSTAIKLSSTFRSMAEIEVALGAETAVEPLSAGSDGDVIAPLLLLDGHVCPLSLGNAGQVQGLSLRNPYHWESHTGASAYILPKWMWRVVGGDAGGGALLMHANTSSSEERGIPTGKATPSSMDGSTAFEPFVQFATWGSGSFHSLLKITSEGFVLDGGSGVRENKERRCKAIRTIEEDLEITPAADLHLRSGTKQGGEVRIGTTGEHGKISLISDMLFWTSTSLSMNSSSAGSGTGFGIPSSSVGTGAEAAGVGARVRALPSEGKVMGVSFKIDAEKLEAKGSTDMKLHATRSFHLAAGEEDRELAGVLDGTFVRGDRHFVNVRAGAVNVEARNTARISGSDGVTLASGSGNVFLDANSGNTSISLGSTAIRGKAPTVALCAGVGVGLGHQASAADACTTSTSNDGPGTAGFGQAGGHLILTAKAAMLGSPANASIEARDEVRLHANNSSLLRVSTTSISLQTPTIVLHSSPLLATASKSDVTLPNASKTKNTEPFGARLSLEGGTFAMNASGSIEYETPGAFVRLIGRRVSGGSNGDVGGGGVASGGVITNGGGGVLVADADAVEINARSAIGVTITARKEEGEGDTARSSEDVGGSGGDNTVGGQIGVSLEGISMEGISTSISSSRRVLLRVEGEREEGGSTIELNDSGIQVVAALSKEIILKGSQVVFEAPKLALSHGGGGGTEGGGKNANVHHKDSSSDIGDGGGGGGLWSDGFVLTGRADQRVFLQAGESGQGKEKRGERMSSHISIEEDVIRVCTGGASEVTPVAPRTAAVTATGEGSCGVASSGSGLSVDVVGTANVSSTEDMKLHGGEMLLSSSNQTLMHSPGGVFLASSSPRSSGEVGTAIPAAGRLGLEQQAGDILLAPGAGAGVGIGPSFSPQDLLAPIGAVPSLLFVTNSTRTPSQHLRPPPDAHLAVESSSNSAIAVLSPRGSTSAFRFGCTELPYSGGLMVQHHWDGHAGDVLLLELASSPGRLVGEASGRWGVGAVPEARLEAALHVFALPKVAEGSGVRSIPADVVSGPELALLVESTDAGVMQILSRGASSPPISTDNAIVLSSRQPGGKRPGEHSHWMISQLGERAAHWPTWTDNLVDRSSWVGGITFTHVFGGGPSGWRRSLKTAPPVAEGFREEDAVRPVIALGTDGRTGFGVGSTGARVTVGGSLLAEQVLVLSDEDMVRDVDSLGPQGREQAMEALRKVEVVSYGWTTEISAVYGLQSNVRQVGAIAQQVEKVSPSLVWKDPTTGRKAVSYSRLLVTLVAAFKHLDASVQAEGRSQDKQLNGLEKTTTATAENAGKFSERLGIIETTAETSLETLLAHGRQIGALDGRLIEQGSYADAAATALVTMQDRAAKERGESQEWRSERSRREKELEQDIRELNFRLATLEEQRKTELKEQQRRQKAQDTQIQALNLRIGSSQASKLKSESSLLAEVEVLRKSYGALEDRLTALFVQSQAAARNEEDFFMDEVQRLEDNQRIDLQDEAHRASDWTRKGPTGSAGDAASAPNGRHRSGPPAVTDASVRQHLEKTKGSIRAEAMSSVLRHREHLNAYRANKA